MWYGRTREVLDIAAELAGNPDGCTVVPGEGQRLPAAGYVVGQRGISGELGVIDIAEWVERELPRVIGQREYFGAWTDRETGVIYLDVVKIFSEFVPACRDADKRGELAIWDLAGQREIRAAEYAPQYRLVL
ncbi:hypothetical protein [Micromonospora sp. GCM10011541]|uniref:hypothetical protein n=1 Tax=Micromonospora sp. GCM10011541 TaxID=3317336 RepID=UPI003621B739